MNKHIFIIILFYNLNIDCTNNAICIVPIADVVTHCFQEINPSCNVHQEYKNLSISGEKGFLNCPRVHQLLYNEQVEILQEFNQEVKIKINNTFLQTEDSKFKNFIFYTLKSNLIPINELDKEFLPSQINLTTDFLKPQDKTITLILPFFEKQTNNFFSIGTRFVYTKSNENNYTIKFFDFKSNSYVQSDIAKKFVMEFKILDINQRIQTFVRLLKLWTSVDKYIPYVWGGCSCNRFVEDKKFNLFKGNNCLGSEILFFKRNNLKEYPYSGFDCSSLILRAAQIAQLPYFFKNTTTLAQNLKPLEINEEIENGDLLWFRGHVLIIIDIKNNLFVEARGYNSGFGRVHQIPFSKFFKDINNVKELKDAYLQNKSLNIYNKSGNPNYLTIKNIKILKLKSVFNQEIRKKLRLLN